MASGFIWLQDGSVWSSRWSRYDCVLEAIRNELPDTGKEAVLKKWISYILPDEDNGDIESGYCFYKNGSEHIQRSLDTRHMKAEYETIFWDTVKALQEKRSAEDSPVGYWINELMECYNISLTRNYKIPDDPYDKGFFSLGGCEIGK